MSAKRIIKQIAIKNNVTTSEVRAELKKAMAISMMSQSPAAKEFRKQLLRGNKNPSVEDFLQLCIEKAKTAINGNSV